MARDREFCFGSHQNRISGLIWYLLHFTDEMKVNLKSAFTNAQNSSLMSGRNTKTTLYHLQPLKYRVTVLQS